MARSAIEESIQSLQKSLISLIRNRDRGVLVGLILVCIPILPVTLLGFIITIWNFYLCKHNKLRAEERKMILWSIAIGIFNLIFGIVLGVIAHTVAQDLSNYMPSFIIELRYWAIEISKGIATFIGDCIRAFQDGFLNDKRQIV